MLSAINPHKLLCSHNDQLSLLAVARPQSALSIDNPRLGNAPLVNRSTPAVLNHKIWGR
jgi:hypothetical protein